MLKGEVIYMAKNIKNEIINYIEKMLSDISPETVNL